MGEYFKDREEERKKEKKIELIDDWGKLIATYSFENERYQYTINEDYKNILPSRTNLLGDNTPNNPGWIRGLTVYLDTSKIGDMSVGGTMRNVLREIKYLADIDENHMDHLETHVEHYQFICESAIQMMENLYKELDALKAKLVRLEGEEIKVEEEIIPPSEKRENELKVMYDNCGSLLDFITLINPKRGGKNFTSGEIYYLKKLNEIHQKFRGQKDRAKEMKEEGGEVEKAEKAESEPQVYSPLSQRPPKKEPLYSDSSENPE